MTPVTHSPCRPSDLPNRPCQNQHWQSLHTCTRTHSHTSTVRTSTQTSSVQGEGDHTTRLANSALAAAATVACILRLICGDFFNQCQLHRLLLLPNQCCYPARAGFIKYRRCCRHRRRCWHIQQVELSRITPTWCHWTTRTCALHTASAAVVLNG